MIRAEIRRGRIIAREPIPPEWEGQEVKVVPLTPDDPIPDLEERLAAFRALGPMEYEEGEREAIEKELAEFNEFSKTCVS